MSNLITCRTCRKPVSANAEFCPHCGEREPSQFVFRSSAIIITVLFLILVIYGIFVLVIR
ncbi:zinc-ribbon domain-containing protein [Dyadobacter luteus]|jgi:RNA polymerase subunit RPABC4/transcription elongation factor Spt4|uniref:zinc-ribbon domain-containing protein n=1 Tax=Dyadobacter luteus TaxID=2259619 RepID=UPI0035B5C768